MDGSQVAIPKLLENVYDRVFECLGNRNARRRCERVLSLIKVISPQLTPLHSVVASGTYSDRKAVLNL